MDISLGYLGLKKNDQTIPPGANIYGINGTFTNIGADLLLLSFRKHY